MKMTIERRLALFAAAGTAFAAVKRLDPPDTKALAAVGLLTAALAPTYEEFAGWALANGQPMPDAHGYAEMIAASQRFAVSVLEAGETQH